MKALARLSVCADASEHWMIKYLISVKSLMSHTKQPFSFENSGCSLYQIMHLHSLIWVIATCRHTAYKHDSTHVQSMTIPFQSNLSKHCYIIIVHDWKNVDSDLKHKRTDKENENQNNK